MSAQVQLPGQPVITEKKRQKALDLIWKYTHPDFRGVAGERWGAADQGQRSIVVYRNANRGSCLALLRDLTDLEIEGELEYVNRRLVRDRKPPFSLE